MTIWPLTLELKEFFSEVQSLQKELTKRNIARLATMVMSCYSELCVNILGKINLNPLENARFQNRLNQDYQTSSLHIPHDKLHYSQ